MASGEAEGEVGVMFGVFGFFQKHSFTHTLASSAERCFSEKFALILELD